MFPKAACLTQDGRGRLEWPPYLRLHVCVVVVLQEQSGCLCVVFAGRDVEGRETHLSLRVVLEQEGHNLVMTLLQSHSQWREAVL